VKVLDLFSGIGGFSLGLERAGMETIAFCEIEDYPRKILAKHWPDIPIAGDVRKLSYNRKTNQLFYKSKVIYVGRPIDVICGGFPCQDISVAGKQAGIDEGTRSGLWSECARLLREIRPEYAIFENVTALLSGERGKWFQRVLFDISEVGFDAEWHCISASELGAHHHRDRAWIVAYPAKTFGKRGGLSSGIQKELTIAHGRSDSGITSEILANPESRGQQGSREFEQPINSKEAKDRQAVKSLDGCLGEIWKTEPGVGRVVDGVWQRSYSHRLGALGNAVVPQIPELIARSILEREGLL
jgi:DNA (cytosine-5)-methyltransferase 1